MVAVNHLRVFINLRRYFNFSFANFHLPNKSMRRMNQNNSNLFSNNDCARQVSARVVCEPQYLQNQSREKERNKRLEQIQKVNVNQLDFLIFCLSIFRNQLSCCEVPNTSKPNCNEYVGSNETITVPLRSRQSLAAGDEAAETAINKATYRLFFLDRYTVFCFILLHHRRLC